MRNLLFSVAALGLLLNGCGSRSAPIAATDGAPPLTDGLAADLVASDGPADLRPSCTPGVAGQLSPIGGCCGEWVGCAAGLHCETGPPPDFGPGQGGSGPDGICALQACANVTDCGTLSCAQCGSCVFDCVSHVCHQRGCP